LNHFSRLQGIDEYLATCQELGGVKDVNFESCVNGSDKCKGFSKGGCSFAGTVLETLPGIYSKISKHLSMFEETGLRDYHWLKMVWPGKA
jgi:hypothetical protein